MGVLLFWNVHQEVGPHGYIGVFGSRNSIPVLLRQADLIDPDGLIEEGSLVNFELKVPGCLDCGISRAAVEGFEVRNQEFDFNSAEVSGFHTLKPERPLDRHLLERLSPELKMWVDRMCAIDAVIDKSSTVSMEASLRQLQKLGHTADDGSTIEGWNQTPQGIIEYINSVIADPLLYQPERFADVKLRRMTQLYLGKNPHGFERIWLNRLLLEDAYPNTLIRKLKGTDCSPEPVRGMVESYDMSRHQGTLKLRNGRTVFFGADAFPAGDIIPRTGDSVQLRQCAGQGYDIWPLSTSNEALGLPHSVKSQAPSKSQGKSAGHLSRGPFQFDLVTHQIKCGKLLFKVEPLYAPVIEAMLQPAPGGKGIITKLKYFEIAVRFKKARLLEEGETEKRVNEMVRARNDEIKETRKRIAQAWRRDFGDWLRDKCEIDPNFFIMCLQKEECYQLGPGWDRERPIIGSSQVGERLMGKNIENLIGPDDEEYKSHMKPKRMGIPGENDDRQGY
jgi:hypothetical protein